MIDALAKEYLHGDLRWIREATVWKLDGLCEYDVRRPLTSTGTNLLGLVKHLATWEARYFGEVFDRPFPEAMPRWDDAAQYGADLWATQDESREEIIDRYRRVWEHSDATISALDIDAPGRVPWWPRANVNLFNVLVHMLAETNRHGWAPHSQNVPACLQNVPSLAVAASMSYPSQSCKPPSRSSNRMTSPYQSVRAALMRV